MARAKATDDPMGTAGGSSSKKKHSIIGNYVVGPELGAGSFARVRHAVHPLTGMQVALKCFRKRELEQDNRHIDYQRELWLLAKTDHSHIVRLYEVLETRNHYCFVLELCEGGELFEYIVQQEQLPEPHAAVLFEQLVQAMQYLHSHHIAHRDLKPENVMISVDRTHLHIVDFGLSCDFTDVDMLETSCGSAAYAAPEVFRGVGYEGALVDIWSLGVILYTLVAGRLPFGPEPTMRDIVDSVRHQTWELSCISAPCTQLLRRIFVTDPAKRPALQDILDSPFMVKRRAEYWQRRGSEPPTVAAPTESIITEDIEEEAYQRLEPIGYYRAAIKQALKTRPYEYIAGAFRLMCHRIYMEKRGAIEGLGPVAASSLDVGALVCPTPDELLGSLPWIGKARRRTRDARESDVPENVVPGVQALAPVTVPSSSPNPPGPSVGDGSESPFTRRARQSAEQATAVPGVVPIAAPIAAPVAAPVAAPTAVPAPQVELMQQQIQALMAQLEEQKQAGKIQQQLMAQMTAMQQAQLSAMQLQPQQALTPVGPLTPNPGGGGPMRYASPSSVAGLSSPSPLVSTGSRPLLSGLDEMSLRTYSSSDVGTPTTSNPGSETYLQTPQAMHDHTVFPVTMSPLSGSGAGGGMGGSRGWRPGARSALPPLGSPFAQMQQQQQLQQSAGGLESPYNSPTMERKHSLRFPAGGTPPVANSQVSLRHMSFAGPSSNVSPPSGMPGGMGNGRGVVVDLAGASQPLPLSGSPSSGGQQAIFPVMGEEDENEEFGSGNSCAASMNEPGGSAVVIQESAESISTRTGCFVFHGQFRSDATRMVDPSHMRELAVGALRSVGTSLRFVPDPKSRFSFNCTFDAEVAHREDVIPGLIPRDSTGRRVVVNLIVQVGVLQQLPSVCAMNIKRFKGDVHAFKCIGTHILSQLSP